jgi:hypothetical protein
MSDFIRLGVVSFAFGAVLLLIALVGGALEIKEVRFGQIPQRSRAVLGVVGVIFIGLGLWVTLQEQPPSQPQAQTIPTDPRPSLPTLAPMTTTSANSTVAPSTTLEPFPTVAERELLTLVPAAFRDQCSRDNDPYENTTASVTCNPKSGVQAAYYMTYKSLDAMKKQYFSFIDARNIKQDTGDCAKNRTEETPYTIQGTAAGRYACYQEGGGVWIIWTNNKLRVLALGYRKDLNAKKLKDWWKDESGPYEP